MYNGVVDPADHRAEALFKSVTRDTNNPIFVISKAPALTSLTSACSCRISVLGFQSGRFALRGARMMSIQTIIDLHNQGITLCEIARREGVTKQAISRRLRRRSIHSPRIFPPAKTKPPRPTEEERFWSRVNKGDGCWSWIGGHRNYGYGACRYHGKADYAHRVSWMIDNKREIPEGLVICHKCDNPNCVNPDHLYLGTQADNMHDRDTRGRGRGKGIPPVCSVDGCDHLSKSKGLCNMHYKRELRRIKRGG